MERGFENGGVVRGLVGGLGGRCGGRVVEQDKASTVSHCARSGFSANLRAFSHGARTVRTVRKHLRGEQEIHVSEAPFWKPPRLL